MHYDLGEDIPAEEPGEYVLYGGEAGGGHHSRVDLPASLSLRYGYVVYVIGKIRIFTYELNYIYCFCLLLCENVNAK